VFSLEQPLVFIVVAVDAQQFPVATVGRIIVMVVVAVVNSKLLHGGAGKLSLATAADPRIHLERLLPVALLAFVTLLPGLGNQLVQFVVLHGPVWLPVHFDAKEHGSLVIDKVLEFECQKPALVQIECCVTVGGQASGNAYGFNTGFRNAHR